VLHTAANVVDVAVKAATVTCKHPGPVVPATAPVVGQMFEAPATKVHGPAVPGAEVLNGTHSGVDTIIWVLAVVPAFLGIKA